jgi:hypothetical protein
LHRFFVELRHGVTPFVLQLSRVVDASQPNP